MFKLLLSAYLIVIIPYITTGYTVEFIVNAGLIAGNNGNTDAYVFLLLAIFVFAIFQLLTVKLIKKYLFRSL